MFRSHVASLRSARSRAALSLGVVLAVGATGTYAHWTDSADITGTTFTSGTFDVQLANSGGTLGDNAAQVNLSMATMVPGATSAEVFTLKNNGNVSMKWSLTGGLNGTDAGAFNTAGAMSILIRENGTKSGSGNSSTCTGGTSLLASTVLTSTTSTSLLASQGPLATTATKSLCIQFTFDSAASGTSLQGKSLGAALTFTGTSNLA